MDIQDKQSAFWRTVAGLSTVLEHRRRPVASVGPDLAAAGTVGTDTGRRGRWAGRWGRWAGRGPLGQTVLLAPRIRHAPCSAWWLTGTTA